MKLIPCFVRLAAYITLVLALQPCLLAQTFVLDNYNAGNIAVTSSTTYGIDQYVSGVLGGVRIIDFSKQNESSATSLTIGSGGLTFNATTPGDWFAASDGYVPSRIYDLSHYNAFEITVLSAPAGEGYLGMGVGDLNGSASGAVAQLPTSGTVIVPFSWWDSAGVDFAHVMDVEVDINAEVPGTYVLDNFQAVLVPEPTMLSLAGLSAAAWMLFRRRQ